jgi:hypothetical protein
MKHKRYPQNLAVVHITRTLFVNGLAIRHLESIFSIYSLWTTSFCPKTKFLSDTLRPIFRYSERHKNDPDIDVI